MGDADLGVHTAVSARDVGPAEPCVAADARLRSEVARAAHALDELLQHRDLLGEELSETITRSVADVRARLDRAELAVVVVGEKKAGKSTFLNAILGARVLPTEVRECTGTVTSIRRAERPTYRATLRSGEIAEFANIEATERASLENAIEKLRQHLELPFQAPQDLDLERATAAQQIASQRRQAAEDTRTASSNRASKVAADIQRAREDCDQSLGSAALLEEQLASARNRSHDEERQFAQCSESARSYAEGHGHAPPGMDGDDFVATGIALRGTEERLASALAAAPFFLRPAPWWAVWVVVLRVLLQWLFRAQTRALADARELHDLARLSLAACESAQRLKDAKQIEANTETRLVAARQQLANAHERLRSAEIDRENEAKRLAAASAAVDECRRAEEIAQLGRMHARVIALEEQSLRRFLAEVHELTDMEKRGQEVLELAIGFPAQHLPDGITIIDTPGVNTDNAPNRERAWEVIRRDADGCLLVSDLQQVVSRSTREFLQEIRAFIPHILLVMTKVDGALANARVVNLEPWQRVEEARRNGVRRFAKEVGRAPEDVFSIAVAAEPALRRNFSGDVLARRFPGEVAKLFDLLHSEKDLVLGARAAAAIRDCVQRIGETETTAEKKYRQRIAELEEQQLPDPSEFRARQLAKIAPAIQTRANAIATHARDAMSTRMDGLGAEWVGAIRASTKKDEVKATVVALGDRGQQDIVRVVRSVEKDITDSSRAALRELEGELLEELRERYRIVQQLTGSGTAIQLASVRPGTAAATVTDLRTNVAGVVSNFENEQLALGAGGAVAGAAIGTIILPGIGTAIGAAVGALASYLKTLESLKNDCVQEAEKNTLESKHHLVEQLVSVGPDVQRMMHEALAAGLSDAIARFDSWIKQVMADEQRHIAAQREKLSHLIKSRDALILQDRTLAAVQRATATLSRGLCA